MVIHLDLHFLILMLASGDPNKAKLLGVVR